VVSPHAGFMYSGHVAGAVFSRVSLPATVIMIGPNHTGAGPPVSIFSEGSWVMPGGETAIDSELAGDILAHYSEAEADTSAHRAEHSLEVQLPFLRYVRPDVRIVPIILGTTNEKACRDLGLCLTSIIQARAAKNNQQLPPLLLASTDMSHYEPESVTREKDRFALEAIQRLNAEELQDTVRAKQISMCGLGPTATVLHAARTLGASRSSLVRYATSGEVTGDFTGVVGYAGFVIS
jgi:AmmeMemoRadiSam system protein B